MKPAEPPADEAQRLQALHALSVLDTAPDPVLDGLVRCAAQLTGCSVALVSLVDAGRQWFKAAVGTDLCETPRDWSFCAHAIAQGDALLEVSDTLQDERFVDNPLVTGVTAVRFYAGVPVHALGHRVGTLCVLDQQPRHLDAEGRRLLSDLAAAVSHWLQSQHTQRQLALQQQRLADFAAAGSDWMWECDTDWRYRWVSEGFAEVSGQTAQALMRQPVPDAVVLDDDGRPLQPLRSVHDLLRAGRSFARAVVQRDYPSGTRLVSVSARPWRDEGGRLLGWRGVARDVSALVAARRLAQQRLQVLAKIADELPGFVYQYRLHPDGTAHFPYASRGAREVYELEPEDLLRDGAAVLGRIHPLDLPRVQRSVADSARELRHWRCEYRVQLPASGERWLEGLASPERESDGSVLWHGFISDVTVRREQAQRVQAAEQRRLIAEQAIREKSQFLAGVSHELRTPLNAVLGFAQLLLESHDEPLTARQDRHVVQVRDSARHLLSLIDDLLQLGELDQGRRQPQAVPSLLQPVLDAVQRRLQPRLQAQGLALRLVPPAGDAAVLADPELLTKALSHLGLQLMSAAPAGATLRLGARARRGRVRLCLQALLPASADGSAHAEAAPPLHARAGSPGSMGGPNAESAPALGALMAQQLLRALGSRLRAAPVHRVGAMWFFSLALAPQGAPAAATQAGTAAAPGTAPRDALPGRQPDAPTVLYIEDDAVNTLLMQELVRSRTDWRLLTAPDCEQGMALVREHRPAMVLTDMNLNGCSGVEVLQALRAEPALRDTLCIALSADALPEHVDAALRAGFDDYITKPIELAALVQRLGDWLQRGRGAAG